MVENLILGKILACLAQIWAPRIFSKVLSVLDIRQTIILFNFKENLQSKLNMVKNLILGLI